MAGGEFDERSWTQFQKVKGKEHFTKVLEKGSGTVCFLGHVGGTVEVGLEGERPIRWYLDHGPGIVTKLGTKGAQVPQAVEEEGGE